MYVIQKNAEGYGYKYTDLAQINAYLDAIGLSYYQFIEPFEGNDYIYTVPVDQDGKEGRPIRGCRVVEARLSGKSNPVQEYGAALTYCRRYSLLMAFGLATTDDDAACLTTTIEEKADPSMIALYEAVCGRKNVDPLSYFKSTLRTNKDYKDMTPKEYGQIMRELNGGKK